MNLTIDRYFAAMGRHDWVELRGCLSDSFRRVGPWEEHVWDDPDDYIAFLRELLPTLKGQKVEVTESVEEGPVVHVNITETIEVEGLPHSVRLASTFRMSPDNRIEHVEIFARRLPPARTGG
jgi:hypothetical protein